MTIDTTTPNWLYYVTATNLETGGTLSFYERGSDQIDAERKARAFVAKYTPSHDHITLTLVEG